MQTMAGVEDVYRSEFRQRVLAGRPRSLLEVGCGSGAFLRPLRNDALRLAGIDPDADAVDALSMEGFEVSVASAESLPFRDGEFDVVAFSYVPHHCADWAAALREAMRVARHSVEILDIWFDESVPDQVVARDFDRWCKVIDRRGGMVHGEALSPGHLIAPAIGASGMAYDYVCRRLHAPWAIGDVEATARIRLAEAGHDPALEAELARILEAARGHGISEEGCVQMTIEIGG
jgi:SAM-dependent methyltransferase